MSLHIDVKDVKAVLLADGWHELVSNSFELDAYEFLEDGDIRLGGGSDLGISSLGARWSEKEGVTVACPIRSIIAVKTAKRPPAGSTRHKSRN